MFLTDEMRQRGSDVIASGGRASGAASVSAEGPVLPVGARGKDIPVLPPEL